MKNDRTIPSDKPNIKLLVNKKQTRMLTDVRVSVVTNVTKKEVEKILKYGHVARKYSVCGI